MAAAPKDAAAAAAPAPKGGPSLVVQLGALVAMTLAAAGMGWVSGGFLTSGKSGAEAAGHAPAAGAHGGKGNGHGQAGGHGDEPPASDTVIPLGAITTSIASPGDMWVRMEVSIVLDEPQGEDLPGIIQQDLLSYIRTVKMHEIEGASGFRHLKENLDERAAIRSDGHVKQVLIRTLLFE
jgi:flagellar FliL protein